MAKKQKVLSCNLSIRRNGVSEDYIEGTPYEKLSKNAKKIANNGYLKEVPHSNAENEATE